MNLKNILRSILNIRTVRALPRAGAMPQVGSSIVLDHLRIKLKYPLNHEQWYWLSKRGWRTIDMRSNRRQYVSVPDHVIAKLLDDTSGGVRDELHQRMTQMGGEELVEWFNQDHQNTDKD